MPTETNVYILKISPQGGFKVYRYTDDFLLLQTTEMPVFGKESDNLQAYITKATTEEEAKDELGEIGLNVLVQTFA